MDLPNLLNRLRHKEQTIRRLLAIEITPAAVKSAVWQVHGTRTEVVSVGSIQAWETEDISDLIDAIDQSLSEALAGLESEPNEVIFGLPETWSTTDGILDNKKPYLKEVTHKLGLKPVGFVVTTEAVIQYLRELEGGPPSAILINIGSDNVAITIVYLGRSQGTQVVGRSQDIGSDVEEGLARFPHTDNLPSRMILFDSREDLDSAKQALIGKDWQAKLPFLHFPKIESLPKDFTVKAVAIAGGAEVAESLGYTDPLDPSLPESTITSTPKSPPIPEPEPESESKPEPEPEPTDDQLSSLPLPVVKEPEPAIVEEIEDLSAEFGFTGPSAPILPPTTVAPAPTPPPQPTPKPSLPRPRPLAALVSAIKFIPASTFRFFRSLFNRPSGPKIVKAKPSRRRWLILALCLIIGLAGAAFWAYWFWPQADITLYVNPQKIDETVTFVLDPQLTAPQAEQQRLPGQKEVVSVSGEKTVDTTGTKTIGDRARGEVTLYNRTTSPKNFAAGTAIKYQNLRFTLDEDVSVASASTKYNADFSVVTEPSKTNVAVTAVDIGDQYNLGSGTQFSIANFALDSYVAANANAFSGGSAHQVAAVSETDRANLRAALIDDLVAQIKADITAKGQGQEVIATDAQTISSETYSAKVQAEADQLTSNLTLEQTIYTYSMTDITLLAQQAAFSKITSGYIIEPSGTQVDIQETVINADDTASIKAKTSLALIPKLDVDVIATDIKGKQTTIADDYLRQLPGFSKSEVVFSPNFAPLTRHYPYQLNRITITIKPIK